MGQPPQGASETTDSMMKGYIDNLDQFINATTRNIIPSEQAQVDAARVINPQQQQNSLDIARQFLPQFTDVGLQQQNQENMGRAKNDTALLEGPGKDLVRANLEAQKIADPEFYSTRAGAGKSMDMLFNSLDDPNGELNGSERAEIERSLARDNFGRGIEAPTSTSAVSNAMNFGAAGDARKRSKQDAINKAVASASQVMPAMKSGVDVLQLTTGRPSQVNQGVGRFGENQQVGGMATNLGSQLMNQVGQNSRQTADINSKKRTAFDTVMGVMDSAGSLASAI